jgi:Toprim domain
MITLAEIDALSGRRRGAFDVPCPLCAPHRRSARNRRKPVLRIWRTEAGFATYHCARCGEQGFARDLDSRVTPLDPARLAQARAETAERDRAHKAKRQQLALWLWQRRRPIAGSIAETYLRDARGYGGPLPATLGFLPSRGDHHPAMIAAFGLALEVEPGVLTIADDAVRGVHLTRLRPDGSGKAVFDDPEQTAKIMIGLSMGAPIVLAPPNDLLGMAITEGLEDGLSLHQDTGLGVWVAGAASRMPALADVVPAFIECTTIVADDDPDGRRFAAELAARLGDRGMDARAIIAGATWGAAA